VEDLSGAARSVWAKSVNDDGAWLPLWQHMDDSADIAGGLFDRWLSPPLVGLLAANAGMILSPGARLGSQPRAPRELGPVLRSDMGSVLGR
jgi:hypothetical protein